jgi:glycosyltransferase involved in cell wall biosynthesis
VRSLRALRALQPGPNWELIVVDNGSSDATASVIEDFRISGSLPLRLITEQRPGLSRARNAGWCAARGEVVCFTDDDCYPQLGYLEAVQSAFRDPNVGFFGGRLELFDPADFPISIQPSKRRRQFAPGQFVPAGLVQGANMAFRRRALEVVEGFDVDLGAGTAFPAEDIDAVWRVSFAGWAGVYEPNALVLHHHQRKAKDAASLVRLYDQGRGAYNTKVLLTKGRSKWLPHAFAWTLRTALSRPSTPFWELWGGVRYLAMRGRVKRRRLFAWNPS